MPVGVFLRLPFGETGERSLPHARGGVSTNFDELYMYQGSSPCPWGCFQETLCLRIFDLVFPMPVGVFPLTRKPRGAPYGLPHARGGVSVPDGWKPYSPVSSPCPWGCFCSTLPGASPVQVFPMPVGVFLVHNYLTSFFSCLPHARGGVSKRSCR